MLCTNVEHVDFLIPRPRVWSRGIGVVIDAAWSIFLKKAYHGRASRATIHPYAANVSLKMAQPRGQLTNSRQWSIGRVFPALEEPKEGVYLIGLVDLDIHQCPRRKLDIARYRFDSSCGLAQAILGELERKRSARGTY
jgi:hypothetical protein